MPLTKNLCLVFKVVPEGLPIPGKHLIVEDRPIDLTRVPDGGFVVRNIYNSLDPYMRLMLVDASTQHYRKPYKLGGPLRSLSVAEIIQSTHSAYPVGALIRASLPIQQYSLIPPNHPSLSDLASSATIKVLPTTPPPRVQPAHWIGPLGMPGLTAFSSIYEIGRPQTGETVFISAAAGAVGQIVGQICKIEGLTVVGSAGSDEKIDLITGELGFNEAFNYKTEKTSEALKRLAPKGIDIYYDNVGGQTLEDALGWMKKDGRIVICGMVSQYNSTSSSSTSESEFGVKNLFQFVSQGLTMRGFQVSQKDFGPKYSARHQEQMVQWIEEGKVKVVMSEAVGMENSAGAFVGMLKGENVGKAVLRVWAGDSRGMARFQRMP